MRSEMGYDQLGSLSLLAGLRESIRFPVCAAPTDNLIRQLTLYPSGVLTTPIDDVGCDVVGAQCNKIVDKQIPILHEQVTGRVDSTEDGPGEKLQPVEGNIPNKPAATRTNKTKPIRLEDHTVSQFLGAFLFSLLKRSILLKKEEIIQRLTPS